jgi:hypothetical protein
MNPYQSPVPIEEESHPWLRFLLFASQEAFLATLSFVVLLAASLLLLTVMPIAIGLAWYQVKKSASLLDLFCATVMTAMLPFWDDWLAVAWAIFMQGRS